MKPKIDKAFRNLQHDQQLKEFRTEYGFTVKDNDHYELSLSQSELYQKFEAAFNEDKAVELRYEHAEKTVRYFIAMAYHLVEPGFQRKQGADPRLWSAPPSIKKFLQDNAASPDIPALKTLFRWCGELAPIVQEPLSDNEADTLLWELMNTCREFRNYLHHELNQQKEDDFLERACKQLHRYCQTVQTNLELAETNLAKYLEDEVSAKENAVVDFSR